MSTIHLARDDILEVIKNLDLNKTHGDDMISIQMIKIRKFVMLLFASLWNLSFDHVIKMENFQLNGKKLV